MLMLMIIMLFLIVCPWLSVTRLDIVYNSNNDKSQTQSFMSDCAARIKFLGSVMKYCYQRLPSITYIYFLNLKLCFVVCSLITFCLKNIDGYSGDIMQCNLGQDKRQQL